MPVFMSQEQKQGCIKELLSAPSLSGRGSELVDGAMHPQGEHPHQGSTPGPETTGGPVPGLAQFLGQSQ